MGTFAEQAYYTTTTKSIQSNPLLTTSRFCCLPEPEGSVARRMTDVVEFVKGHSRAEAGLALVWSKQIDQSVLQDLSHL